MIVSKVLGLLEKEKGKNNGTISNGLKKQLVKLSAYVNGFEVASKQGKKKDDEEIKKPRKADYFKVYRKLKYNGNYNIGILTKECFGLFSKEKKKLSLKIPLSEMIGIHRLSKLKKDEKSFGALIGCVSVLVKKFFPIEIYASKKNEKQIVKDIQQASFLGELSENGSLKKRKLLVIINPIAGGKKGVKLFGDIVRPIFDFCHFKYETIVTEHAHHATKIIRELDTSKYSEIVSCGGDGTFHEVIQGLFQHPKINHDEVKNIPISIIPFGTGNALAWEMGCDQSPAIGALICARGRTVSYDTMSMLSPNEKIYSFLFFAYGCLPDVDLGFKSIKWMGDVKYMIGGIISCLKRTLYGMELSYVQDEKITSKPTDEFVPPKLRNIYVNAKSVALISSGEKKVLEDTLLEKHFPKEYKQLLEKIKKKQEKKKKEDSDSDESSNKGKEESEKKKDSSDSETNSSSNEEEGGEEIKNSEDEDSSDLENNIKKKKSESEDTDEEEGRKEKKSESEEEDIKNSKKREESEGEDDEDESEGEEENSEEEEDIRDGNTVVKKMNKPIFFMAISNSRKFSYDIWAAGRTVPGNGTVDLIAIHDIGMVKALSCFAKMMGKTPDHLDDASVIGKRIVAFMFKPKGPKYSLVDIDGEEKETTTVMAQVHQGLLTLCHIE